VFRTYKNKEESRILEAYCNCNNKCKFKININLGTYVYISDAIAEINDELNYTKKRIIIHKNDIFFGIIKNSSDIFQGLVKQLELLNSDYNTYYENNILFNSNQVSDDNVKQSEKELIRIINTFNDVIMSNPVLKLLYDIQRHDLFYNGSLSFINYYVCIYFITLINNEINKLKQLEYNKEKNKKNKLLKQIKELFNRIVKHKYGKMILKKDNKTNSIQFINNFANNTEVNDRMEEAKTNEFNINIKKGNIKNQNRKNDNVNEDEENDNNVDNVEEYEDVNNNTNNEAEDEAENEDEDEDEDDYKKEPIVIGKEIELEEVEELK